MADRQIEYWAGMLEGLDESAAGKRAYLDIVSPKGIRIYDDNGKRLDFGFKLNDGMAAGWSGVDRRGNVVCLSDWKSGYDGKDVSVLLLSKFLEGWGYELVDER